MSNSNGNVRLTWQQFVWGVSMILLLGAGWYDLRARQEALAGQQVVILERLDHFYRVKDIEHGAFDARIRRLERESP